MVDWLLKVRSFLEREPSPRARRWLLLIAAVVFVGGTALGLSQLDVDPAEVGWVYLALAGLVGVPVHAVVNALEYHTSGAVIDRAPEPRDALRVSVLGTAANLLPLPGAALVRLRGLRQLGSGYGPATLSTAAIGLAWVGVAAAFAGVWLAVAGEWILGLIFLAGSTLLVMLVAQMLARAVEPRARRWWALRRILAVEVLLVAAGVLRQWLVLLALGADPAFAGAIVLVLSATLAYAAGIFPGGLGLREALSALLAPVVGLPPSFGFVGAAASRVLELAVYAPLALWLSAGVSDVDRDAHAPVGDGGQE